MQDTLPSRRDIAPDSTRPPPTHDDVRAQLNQIVTSPQFPHIGRSAAFLTYAVEETLAGRAARIKGYSVAVEVFKRPNDFTQDDPVVRIEAGRLRQVLERYYLTAGRHDPIRIDIPKGGYVPTFAWTCSSADNSDAEDQSLPLERAEYPFTSLRRHMWAVALGLIVIVGGAVALAGLTSIRFGSIWPFATADITGTDGPTLVIAPFANLGDGPQAQLYAKGLTEELLAALPRFKEIKVFGRETSRSLPPEVGTSQIRGELGARFLLAGGVRVSGSRVRVTARLLDTQTDAILWSQTYDDDIGVRDLFTIQSDVANKVASAVAQPYGIMAQADVSKPPPDDLGIYGCTLSFYAYRAELSIERHGEVRNCLESAVARYPSFATAWAMLSIVYLDEDRFRFNRKPISSAPIDRSFQAARRAVQLDPANTRALQALMTTLFFSQRVPEALQIGERALATNPNDTELLGEFGTRLAMSGEWQRGAALLDRAIALNPAGGGYYRGTRALAAYMLHDDKTAVIEIRQADLQKFPLFHAVAAVIYVDAGMVEDARSEASQFNEMRPDFIANIVAELKMRNFQPQDRARMIADLRTAGLPAMDEVQATMSLPIDGSNVLQPR
ncbi:MULTISPECIES: adenylate cyclase [Rhizobium]|uniref:adenylate cyclase n=1 Tax=Rhizobium TaxID=379 RepID=UPI000BE8B305|nr:MULTISPECIES: adenylate cyclase [Rhizobium]MBB3523171.1 TolB-like protein [Rhizobium sp. BK456]MBY4589278.1 adenylate cyclase [Rhizobium redzepovicii]MBY4613567.1 adenylate cyclase [Rhizobium redzepovicii]MDF0658873.1 adenylate cyclase [Rhizobium sp. BC49]MDR9782090.1 adenylate cyclase [Rhizobium redzepovicii]